MDALKRIYSFSDGHLSLISNQIVFALRRDLADFDGFGGITPATISNLETLIADYNDIPTDEYYEGLKMIKTEEKDEVRVLLNTKISEIMALVALKYGKSSARYRHFGVSAITAQTDEQVQRISANIIRCANLYLTDLATVGLTQTRINELTTLKNDLITGLDEQGYAVRDRDIATENRIAAGNAVYEILISFMNIGKTFWRSRNEAKYNDYVMYDEKGKAQNDEGDAQKTDGTITDTPTVATENNTDTAE